MQWTLKQIYVLRCTKSLQSAALSSRLEKSLAKDFFPYNSFRPDKLLRLQYRPRGESGLCGHMVIDGPVLDGRAYMQYFFRQPGFERIQQPK